MIAANAHRLSERSALFPTNTMMTSLPRSERTSSIHLVVDMNDCRSGEGCEKAVFEIVNKFVLTCDVEDYNGNGGVSDV
jgi:hypothetical protein